MLISISSNSTKLDILKEIIAIKIFGQTGFNRVEFDTVKMKKCLGLM